VGLLDGTRAAARRFIAADFGGMAEQAGSLISAAEVKPTLAQQLGISEFMHPRVEEIADTLPPGAVLAAGNRMGAGYWGASCGRAYCPVACR